MCVYCSSWSGLVELLVVSVYGDTAMVGDGSGHGCHPRNDACGGVVTQDIVRGFAILSSAAENEDLPITHRHAAALLQEMGRRRENFQWWL